MNNTRNTEWRQIVARQSSEGAIARRSGTPAQQVMQRRQDNADTTRLNELKADKARTRAKRLQLMKSKARAAFPLSDEEFETLWPQIRDKLIVNATVAAVAKMSRGK